MPTLSIKGFLLCCLLAVAVNSAPRATAETPTHPLAGRVLDTHTGTLTDISDPALVPRLFPCGAITLLGEVHDNGEHHRQRGDLLRAAVAASRTAPATCGRGGLVFEHLSIGQKPGLDRFFEFERRARRPATTADFFRLVDWRHSAWPDSALFKPLFREAIRSKRQIYPGHPDQAWVRRVAKGGAAELPPERLGPLGLDKPLPADLARALDQDLQASHCGMPAPATMADAQRYRDAYMAEQTKKAADEQGSAVLFAGNGHVRADRGVPRELRRTAPSRTVVTVAFVETEDGATDPTGYGPKDPAGKPATDFVAFALPAPREDPCEAMKNRIPKK